MKRLLLYFTILPTTIIADTFLWCDSPLDNERTKHYLVVIAPPSEFYRDDYGGQYGPICETDGFWTSETVINDNLYRKYEGSNLSIEDQLKRIKERNSRFCDADGGKSVNLYSWFRFRGISWNYERELDRKTLTLKNYQNSQTRYITDQCEVTNQESALLKYNGLLEKQKKVNEKLTKEAESQNVI